MMNALQIARAVAINVNIPPPSVLVTAVVDNNAVKLLQMMNEAGSEIAERVDWGALEAAAILTGTGSNDAFALPADFDRLTAGSAVMYGGSPVRGSLTRDEWVSLAGAEGSPRYFFLSAGAMSFYPFPASAETITVSYLGKNWCGGGTAFNADDDEPVIPDQLIVKGAIWRWKRNTGADYQDYMAEFEADLERYAQNDRRERQP